MRQPPRPDAESRRVGALSREGGQERLVDGGGLAILADAGRRLAQEYDAGGKIIRIVERTGWYI